MTGSWITSPMLNFLLGTVAGGLIAGVLTIAAARQPEVQQRLGLKPVAAMVAQTPAARPPATDCAKSLDGPTVGTRDMLFNRQRFWSVTP